MRILALFLLGILPSLPAAAQSKAPPNVILITMDTVRADRMGFLGSTAKLTPNLDAIATQSIVFSRAYSQVPLTTASHASILTGTYPQFHGVNDFGKPLPGGIPTLATELKQRGYTTAAFVGSVILDAKSGLAPGFDRGFDVYDAGYRVRRSAQESRYGTIERRAMEVVQRASGWLKAQRGPFFLWIHLYDAHDPYEPPAPYATRGSSRYDGEVAYVDAAIGRFIATLKAQNLYGSAALLITADHGEALGEHGERTHGVFLYDETIRVPMLLKLPNSARTKRVDARVQLVDVAPTLLGTSGAKVPSAMQGRSLLAKTLADEDAYAETHYPSRAFGWSALAALRRDRYLFVRAPKRELYDVQGDPKEARNLAASSAAVADVLSAQLDQFRAKTAAGGSETATGMTPEQAQQLAALGYVVGGTSESASAKASGIDPKDKVEVANILHDAILAIEEGQYAEAQPLLQRVIRDDPQIYTAQYQLGLSYSKQKNFDEAIPHFQKAIAIQPDSAIAHYELGLALYEKSELAAAASELEQVTEKMPKWADAQYSLASVYARVDRIKDALDRLQLALEANPEHFRANLLTGRILALQGRPDVGVTLLEKAVQLEPNNSEAHAFLADAYRRLGKTNEARVHEQKSRELARPQ
jgi:arylsulfatase A-like enzyme/thioredoxin-like negative regulator of GroEL